MVLIFLLFSHAKYLRLPLRRLRPLRPLLPRLRPETKHTEM